MAPSDNIFVAGFESGPPKSIPVNRAAHPEPKQGINQNAPIETNKFYANFLLESQSQPVWTVPCSIAWVKGGGSTKSWGMSITHIEEDQLALGAWNDATQAVTFYANPAGLQHIIVSASELGENTTLTTDSLTAFSVNCNISADSGSTPLMTFPLCQGIGFVTAIFSGATPLIQSGIGFTNLSGPTSIASTTKFRADLADGSSWLMYIKTSDSSYDLNSFVLNNDSITAANDFQGTIQIAKSPSVDFDYIYDASAGVYPTSMTISANVSDSKCFYNFSYEKAGSEDSPLLTFALAHHIKSFDDATKSNVSDLQLRSPTKGMAFAVAADTWTMVEPLPTSIGFDPWSPDESAVVPLSDDAKSAINSAARYEMSGDASEECNQDSMYYSGKALAKWAQMVYVVSNLAPDQSLQNSSLGKLIDAFDIFVQNQQTNPLTYDTTWGGVISTAGLSGDSGADFGNSYFNDHHFHYGYFVFAAAIIASLNPDWLNQGNNKDYVDSLIRDFASPVTDDYFPFSRSFDWYHGHSWAKGLFESADGKDQESSSEDAFASYGLKMWGRVTGDANQEARGNLMLAIQARSFQTYFLMTNNNVVQPKNFIGNKADGILFDNKIDHTTYFGANPEYVEGIHMIPLNPCSKLIRTDTFVQEEWDVYFSNGRAMEAEGGWQGLLMANLALIDPMASYNYFASDSFDLANLDGGASRTWYLTYAAMLGGQTSMSNDRREKHTSFPKPIKRLIGGVRKASRRLKSKMLCSEVRERQS